MPANTTIRFQAGSSHFAVDRSEVDRLVPVPRLAVPPGAPPVLAGFFSLGAELVCVLRFSKLFELSGPDEPGLYDHIILLREREPRIGLLVERVVAVFDRGEHDAKPLAAGLSHRDCVSAEVSHEDHTLPLIDTKRLISEFERECAAYFVAAEERRRSALEEACE